MARQSGNVVTASDRALCQKFDMIKAVAHDSSEALDASGTRGIEEIPRRQPRRRLVIIHAGAQDGLAFCRLDVDFADSAKTD